TPVERSRRALQYAMLKKIDLVSAYLVLHGLIPPDAAVPLGEGKNPDGSKATKKPRIAVDTTDAGTAITEDLELTSFDPGYCEAIEHGFLTFQEAVERGDRVAFATELSQQYDLQMDLAFMVADNVIDL